MPSKKELEKAKRKQEERELLEQKQKEDAEWEVGVNKKANDREKKKQEKQEEKMAKNKLMNDLLEAEDYAIKGKKPKTKKGKDDFKLLNEALKSAPKTKQQRQLEEKKKEDESKKHQMMLLEEKKKEIRIKEEQEKRELKAKGIVCNKDFDVKFTNSLQDDEINITGLDGAIDMFSENSKSTKGLYHVFYNEQLEILKQKNPGLKLSQYRDKIDKLWKNSAINPMNKV